MREYQKDFIEFSLESDVLRFGEFVLKSGRKSPYFFNAGLFNTGASLATLGQFYADRLLDWGQSFDVLFGPAYKGIPLAVSVAMALSARTGNPVPFCFNRKEAKDHGEGGIIVGAELKGRVVIIDDVVTAGISVDESIDIIDSAGACTGSGMHRPRPHGTRTRRPASNESTDHRTPRYPGAVNRGPGCTHRLSFHRRRQD